MFKSSRYLIVFVGIMSLVFAFQSIHSKDKSKKVVGTFPEYIEVHYSDPPCDCWISDDFAIIEKGSQKSIAFYDQSLTYLNEYYFVEQEHDEEEWPGYGGATYRLKEEYIGREFTITYNSKLCPGYKSCEAGKIYKNMIITIK